MITVDDLSEAVLVDSPYEVRLEGVRGDGQVINSYELEFRYQVAAIEPE